MVLFNNVEMFLNDDIIILTGVIEVGKIANMLYMIDLLCIQYMRKRVSILLMLIQLHHMYIKKL